MSPPIPQRIAPLVWRRPAFIWTPLALAAAIGWPLSMFREEAGLQLVALVSGFCIFGVTLLALVARWASGKPPKTRREIVMQVLLAASLAALIAPFAGPGLLSALGHGQAVSPEMAVALTPLSLLLVLPISFVSGIVFAWLALTRGRLDDDLVLDDQAFSHDAQLFR